MLSPLLFIMDLEALSNEFCVGLPWELFYADDLCLIAEIEEELVQKIRVNMDKMKVMCCKVRTGQAENSGRWPCAVCKAGVGSNSINCRLSGYIRGAVD